MKPNKYVLFIYSMNLLLAHWGGVYASDSVVTQVVDRSVPIATQKSENTSKGSVVTGVVDQSSAANVGSGTATVAPATAPANSSGQVAASVPVNEVTAEMVEALRGKVQGLITAAQNEEGKEKTKILAEIAQVTKSLSAEKLSMFFGHSSANHGSTSFEKIFRIWQSAGDADAERASLELMHQILQTSKTTELNDYLSNELLKSSNSMLKFSLLHSAIKNKKSAGKLLELLLTKREVVKELLNARMIDGHTALTLAVQNNDEETVKRILEEKGVDVSFAGGDNPSRTAQEWARVNENYKIIDWINAYKINQDYAEYQKKSAEIAGIVAQQFPDEEANNASAREIDLRSFAAMTKANRDQIKAGKQVVDSQYYPLKDTVQVLEDVTKNSIGFEAAKGSVSAIIEAGLRGAVQYNQAHAPYKTGFTGPASIGKTTFIDNIITASKLPPQNVHKFTIKENQITLPIDEIAKYGIRRGEKSLPQLFVIDELFKLKKWDELTEEEKKIRKASIVAMNGILGNGNKSFAFKRNPDVAVDLLIEKLAALKAKEGNRNETEKMAEESEAHKEVVAVLRDIKEEYRELLGGMANAMDASIIEAVMKNPETMIPYLYEQSSKIAEEKELIFPHVYIMYSGLMPKYQEINQIFGGQQNKSVSSYLDLVKTQMPDPQREFDRWASEDFVKGLKDDDCQRLGFNRSLVHIQPFSERTWTTVVERDFSKIFQEKLKAEGIQGETTLKLKPEALELALREVVDPKMGRRNLQSILQKYYAGVVNKLVLKIKSDFEKNKKLQSEYSIDYDRAKMVLSALAGNNLEPIAEDSLNIGEELASVVYSSKDREALEKAIFYDVSIRAMKSMPASAPLIGPTTQEDFLKLWAMTDASSTINWRLLLESMIAKRYASNIFFPNMPLDVAHDPEARATDQLILRTIKTIKQNIEQNRIVIDQCGKVFDAPVENNKVLKMIAETPVDQLETSQQGYRNILSELVAHTRTAVYQNKQFIAKFQRWLLDLKSKNSKLANIDIADLEYFYRSNFPSKPSLKLSEALKSAGREQKGDQKKIHDNNQLAKKEWKETRRKILHAQRGIPCTGIQEQLDDMLYHESFFYRITHPFSH